MATAQLIQVAVFLAAAAIAAPLGRSLRMGAVLGYLAAGVIIGPYVLGPYYALDDVDKVLHFGEFGVVMLLFVIGLELRPVRLWAMRSAIFGLGTAQLIITGIVLAAIGIALGLATGQALFIGLALALSSTAFALQVLEADYLIDDDIPQAAAGNTVRMGIEVDEIRALGGGARSGVWSQIKADVLGLPVVTTEIEEAASLGAAILAGVAVGTFASLEDAVARAVVVKNRFEPDPANRATYDAAYATYRELYTDLVGLFGRS